MRISDWSSDVCSSDLTEIAEDYVELIADLIRTTGEARAVDIARRLAVTQTTVLKTISRLRRDGLVTARPYRPIFLTERSEERRVGERCGSPGSSRWAPYP